jgi:hypothetical protein
LRKKDLKFEASWGNIGRPCLKRKPKQNKEEKFSPCCSLALLALLSP